MAVFYNKVERVNPSDTKAAKKWYAVIKSLGQIGEKEVAKQIADETTLNRKEAEMALAQFEKILIRLLTDGHTVQLGDWGSFRLTCSSKGHDRREDVNAESIKSINIRFTPGIELKEAIQKTSLISTETMTSKK